MSSRSRGQQTNRAFTKGNVLRECEHIVVVTDPIDAEAHIDVTDVGDERERLASHKGASVEIRRHAFG